MLLAHVVLYISMISLAMDAVSLAGGKGSRWSDFWSTISPYTMLYTAGRCLDRLSKGGDFVYCVIGAYIVFRSLFPQRGHSLGSLAPNVDFVANRTLVQAVYGGFAIYGVNGVLMSMAAVLLVAWHAPSGVGLSLTSVMAMGVARQLTDVVGDNLVAFVGFLTVGILVHMTGHTLDWRVRIITTGISLNLSALLAKCWAASFSTGPARVVVYFICLQMLTALRPPAQSVTVVPPHTQLAHIDAPLGAVGPR